jgi:hypothetical protein
MSSDDYTFAGPTWQQLLDGVLIRAGLEPDARTVVRLIVERLIIGRKAYGALHLDVDERDWVKEASDEVLDLSVYMACHLTEMMRVTRDKA